MKFVLDFSDPKAVSVDVSGGKGSSLAKLVQADFPVPGGFVITADAYRCFISSDRQLDREIDSLDFENPDRLRMQCGAIRERLRSVSLPPEVQTEALKAINALLAHGAVSVRSSSTMEDLAGAAFAGQHDTFLNVSAPGDVAESVVHCFASLWGDRAVRYRHEHGFGQRNMSMAVVVQTMVPSEVAGVAFSLNPINGDLGKVSISAAWGLGEMDQAASPRLPRPAAAGGI